MAIHDLKPKDVTIPFTVKFTKLEKKKKNDKHEKGQEKPVSKPEQNKSGTKT